MTLGYALTRKINYVEMSIREPCKRITDACICKGANDDRATLILGAGMKDGYLVLGCSYWKIA